MIAERRLPGSTSAVLVRGTSRWLRWRRSGYVYDQWPLGRS
jgi:hypothetical protein